MTDGLPDSLIPYDEIVQEALRAVVGRVLGSVAEAGGLPGEHHFYITFKTQAPGVDIPKRLIERFPDEMTIVMQNRYWDLIVDDERFSIGLSFNQVPSRLMVTSIAVSAVEREIVAVRMPPPITCATTHAILTANRMTLPKGYDRWTAR